MPELLCLSVKKTKHTNIYTYIFNSKVSGYSQKLKKLDTCVRLYACIKMHISVCMCTQAHVCTHSLSLVCVARLDAAQTSLKLLTRLAHISRESHENTC